MWKDNIIVSDKTNLFLISSIDNNAEDNDIEEIKDWIYSYSNSKEKILIILDSYSKDKENYKISYPLSIDMFLNKEKVFSKSWIWKSTSFNPILWITKSNLSILVPK